MKLHQGAVFIDGMVNSTKVVVQSKKNFVKETIDTVGQLTETTLGTRGTSIHSILNEHLTVKRICSRWIPYNLLVTKKGSCRLV